MLEKKVIYVVGNKFANFTVHDGVYTFSHFVDALSHAKNGIQCQLLVFGQGLTEEEKNILKALVIHSDIGFIQEPVKPLASSEISHKHKVENIMISSPEKLDDNRTFFSQLYLNDDCAEMSDHVTGQHIQGMVLTEAARQMMLAVAEKYILKTSEQENSYCALLKMSAQFFQFGFPIETKMIHKIESLISDNSGKYSACTKTHFLQNDRVIATVSIDYMYKNKAALEAREIVMAREVLMENRQLKLSHISMKKVA